MDRNRARARFIYADNNHNNGFAYHRVLAPRDLSSLHCGWQPLVCMRVCMCVPMRARACTREGSKSQRAEGELNAVQTRRYHHRDPSTRRETRRNDRQPAGRSRHCRESLTR